MAAFSPKTVHVLLVDSDMNNLVQTHRLLHYSSLKVSALQEVASSFMLSKDGVGVDIVMVNPNCFNPLGFISFVRDAVKMGAIVILMCTKANTSQVKCAIEDGAYLVMEKPITYNDIKYLWQYVLHEKAIKRIIAKKSSFIGEAKSPSLSLSKGNITNRGMPMVSPSLSLSKGNNITNRGMPMVSPSFSLSKGNITNGGMPMVQDSIVMNKATCQKRAVEYLNFGPPSSHVYTSGGKPIKRKTCMTWKPDIHQKFIDAVKKLGDGKCFPKDIVELMNVPGLTRMQVASHLQKCRGPSAEYQRKVLMSSKSQPSKKRRFGMCPLFIEDPQDIPRQEEEDNNNNDNNNNMEQFYWPPNFGAPYNIASMGSQEAAPKSVDMGSEKAPPVTNIVNMGSQEETPNFANMSSKKAATGLDVVNMASQMAAINFVNMGSQEEAPAPVVNMASQEAAPTVVNMELQQEELSAILNMFNSMPNGNMIGHIADAPAPAPAPAPMPAPVAEPKIVSEPFEPAHPPGLQFDIPLDIPIAEEFDLQFFDLDPHANGARTWPNAVAEEASGNSVWSFWDML